jgi:hypothetical protein
MFDGVPEIAFVAIPSEVNDPVVCLDAVIVASLHSGRFRSHEGCQDQIVNPEGSCFANDMGKGDGSVSSMIRCGRLSVPGSDLPFSVTTASQATPDGPVTSDLVVMKSGNRWSPEYNVGPRPIVSSRHERFIGLKVIRRRSGRDVRCEVSDTMTDRHATLPERVVCPADGEP